jgi:hypothetical protein
VGDKTGAASAPTAAVQAVSVLGWGSVAGRGQYSLMLPAGLLLRREYLEVGLALDVVCSCVCAGSAVDLRCHSQCVQ